MTDFDAAASAPVTEEVVTEAPAGADAQEMSEDDALSAAFDRAAGGEDASTGGTDDQAPEGEQAGEEPEAAEAVDSTAEAKEATPAPSYLPREIKDVWGDVPEAAQSAFSDHYKAVSDKLAVAQREVNGIAPIKGALVEAIQSNPSIANMAPEQVAAQIPELIKIGQRLSSDPVNTLLTVAQQHGVLEQFAKMAGMPAQGQGNEAALQQEIATLKQQLSDMNPDKLYDQFNQRQRQETAMTSVQQFAQDAEHWAEVEQHLPHAIPMAQGKLGDGASEMDVLKLAYETAVQFYLPEKAPKQEAAAEAAPAPDPEKAQEALKAKSVNVTGKSTGKPRQMTEDEALSGAFERAQK